MHADRPFASAYDPRSLFLSDAWRDCLARLEHDLGAREPILLVTGPAGTGKTTLLSAAAARLGERAQLAHLMNPILDRLEFLEEIARRFGADPPAAATKPQLLACLERTLDAKVGGARVPVLVIENSERLPAELLDELGLLLDCEAQRRLEVALVGSGALEAQLADPAFATLRQRVAVHCQLAPFAPKETRDYLHHRVRAAGGDGASVFPRKTCREIHQQALGIPRTINTLAAEAMRLAKEAGMSVVSVEHVEAAARKLRVSVSGAEAPSVTAGAAAAPMAVEARAMPDQEQEAMPDEAPQARRPETPTQVPSPAPVETVAQAPAKARATTPAPFLEVEQPEVASSARVTALSPEARVDDWLSRFAGDGPPRIGGAFLHHAPLDRDEIAELEKCRIDSPAVVSGREQPPRRLIVLEDLGDAPLPGEPVTAPIVRLRRRKPSAGTMLAVGALAVAVVAVVAFLAREIGSLHRAPSPVAVAAPDPTAASASAVTPTANPATASVARAATRAAKVAATQAPAATPATKAPAPTASKAKTTPAGTPAADSTAAGVSQQRLFGLEVGTFLDPDRAEVERSDLAEQSGLRAWVAQGFENDAPYYRVVLGVFSTERRAEASADILLERGLVSEARVVALPATKPRE